MKSNDQDPHIDWSRFGKKSREQINAEAAEEKKRLGLTGKYERFQAHINGRAYDVPMPDVRSIRERLSLSQAEFAECFNLSQRTLQQWEQRRAMPDMPARVLLKVIQRAPGVVAEAAAEVQREMTLAEPQTNASGRIPEHRSPVSALILEMLSENPQLKLRPALTRVADLDEGELVDLGAPDFCSYLVAKTDLPKAQVMECIAALSTYSRVKAAAMFAGGTLSMAARAEEGPPTPKASHTDVLRELKRRV
jgi:DNA-binding transcriptional regulator YiaG